MTRLSRRRMLVSRGLLAFVHQVAELFEAALDEAGDGLGTSTSG